MWNDGAQGFSPQKSSEQGQSWDPLLLRAILARCYVDENLLFSLKFCTVRNSVSYISCWLSIAEIQPGGHTLLFYSLFSCQFCLKIQLPGIVLWPLIPNLLLQSTLSLCCFGCTVINRTGFEEHLVWRDSGSMQLVGKEELETHEVKQGAGGTASRCFR